MPIQPNEPSCQAISIQVSIISSERGLNTACRDGIERRHQPTGPHFIDNRAGERAHPFGFGGLGPNEVPHPPSQRNNLVLHLSRRRHWRSPIADFDIGAHLGKPNSSTTP